jgi:endoglucanase
LKSSSLAKTLLVCSVVLLLAAMLAPARAASGLAGPLRTSGRQIFDANGFPVRLRGVNIAKLEWYPYVDWRNIDVSGASFDAMKTWGVNAVRVHLGEQYWFSTVGCPYTISPADYQRNVATVVNRITSRGMVAILDLHWNTKYSGQFCNKAGQQRMADKRAITFWQQAANLLKGNALVVFDLYNEPHDIPWSVWRNGGTVLDTVPWTAAGMQQMYDAIRGTGARNLVFVSGNHWAHTPPSSTYLLSGYNIVYAAHYYTCPTAPPPALNCLSNPYDPAPPGQRLDVWTPFASLHPVSVSEFGWPDEKNGIYNQNVINWAESRGVSWQAFNWDSELFGLIDGYLAYNPTKAGSPVKLGVALNP